MTPVKEASFLSEWLRAKNPKELDVFIEELPALFSDGDPRDLTSVLADDGKSLEWRKDLLSRIGGYFKGKGSKKSYFAWHERYLLNCFDKVFSRNRFFSKMGANWQWGVYVMGWFLMQISEAKSPAYRAKEISADDIIRTYI